MAEALERHRLGRSTIHHYTRSAVARITEAKAPREGDEPSMVDDEGRRDPRPALRPAHTTGSRLPAPSPTSTSQSKRAVTWSAGTASGTLLKPPSRPTARQLPLEPEYVQPRAFLQAEELREEGAQEHARNVAPTCTPLPAIPSRDETSFDTVERVEPPPAIRRMQRWRGA